jgi:Xaa-Pro aminopeptidase
MEVDTLVFPSGTTGFQVDVLARKYLWSEGMD